MEQVMNIFMLIFAIVYVLFLPGFFITYALFGSKQIDVIERIALSFALSIAVVPLVAFYLNLMGIKLTMYSVLLEIIAILSICVVILLYKDYRTRKKSAGSNSEQSSVH